MVRNDYRRALILLRSNAAEYSGHVRLERRTLMGSMYFVLRAPEDAGTLQAALVGRGKDSYYACPLGALRRDMRGQMTLGWSFNPRDICGRELEQYQKIVVARVDGNDCSIVLFGNINGFAEMNWERVRTAVCLSLQEGPARGMVEARQDEPESCMEDSSEDMQPPEPAAADAYEEKTGAGTAGEAYEKQDCDEDASEEAESEIMQIMPEAQAPQQRSRTAAEAAGLNTDLPWPESIESLRPLFRSQTPLEGAPDQSYTYILAPMPAGSGYSECAIGLQGVNGSPVAVCYALKSHYTTQPPAGMEDYSWIGNGNEGWWKLEAGVQDGADVSGR